MKLTGNTIFVTGGGSGIGRGLAETLHRLGNQGIISGRRNGRLAETTKANPGMTTVYCSTKAAIHSYTLSLRYKLKGSSVEVLEIAPPWVQTDLLNSNNEPRAMPLAEFISETIEVMRTGAQEVLVERAKPLRNNVGPNEGGFVTQFNDTMAQPNS